MNSDTLSIFGLLIITFAVFGAVPFAGMRSKNIRRVGFIAALVGVAVGICVMVVASNTDHRTKTPSGKTVESKG